MKKITISILILALSGCSLLQGLTSHSDSILSGISPSNLTCVDVKNLNYTNPDKIYSEVSTAFSAGNFAKLEQYYDVYSKRTSRISTGRWSLDHFYESFYIDISSKDENYWRKHENKLQQWIKAFPRSPAPYIAYSSFLISRGYKFRGEGFASDVPPEAWETFYKDIDLAMSNLYSKKEISSIDPKWYSTMINIAKLKGFRKSQVSELLREALSKEAYYYDTYHEAFAYLLPKWGGSFAEAEKFANSVTLITDKCEGKGIYTRLYLRAFRYQNEFTDDPNNLFDRRKVNWSRMSEGFIDLISRYSGEFYLNQYAKYSCLARDKTKTKILINQIGIVPNKEVWEDTRPIIDFSWCKTWASKP